MFVKIKSKLKTGPILPVHELRALFQKGKPMNALSFLAVTLTTKQGGEEDFRQLQFF